jgi:hypothetical protein
VRAVITHGSMCRSARQGTPVRISSGGINIYGMRGFDGSQRRAGNVASKLVISFGSYVFL